MIFDNGGETLDRYTLVFDGHCWGMSEKPFHPHGYGQYVGELGLAVSNEWIETQTEVQWHELPTDVQQFIDQIVRNSIGEDD